MKSPNSLILTKSIFALVTALSVTAFGADTAEVLARLGDGGEGVATAGPDDQAEGAG